MNNIVKLNLSTSFPKQVDQGQKVAAMSRTVITGTEPLIDSLDAANTDLAAKMAAAQRARQAARQAQAALLASAKGQKGAYTALGNEVNNLAQGEAAFVLSTGYGVRSKAVPYPPIEHAPTEVRTAVNGSPGRVIVSWKGVRGARNYEVQYTTDLTGATGWVSAPAMSGGGKLAIDGLNSGTKYGFRVRACGNGTPGPWSGPVQQMAP